MIGYKYNRIWKIKFYSVCAEVNKLSVRSLMDLCGESCVYEGGLFWQQEVNHLTTSWTNESLRVTSQNHLASISHIIADKIKSQNETAKWGDVFITAWVYFSFSYQVWIIIHIIIKGSFPRVTGKIMYFRFLHKVLSDFFPKHFIHRYRDALCWKFHCKA